LEAIEKYQQAAQLMPGDATPLGNLSAAHYEIGQYSQCIASAEKALEVLHETPEASTATIQKLQHRIKKAKLNYN